MARQTSIESFIKVLKNLSSKQEEVYEAISRLGEATDYEIAEHLKHDDPNRVRPRRHELMEQGLVGESTRRECRVTTRRAIVWKVISPCAKQKPKTLSHRQFQTMINKLDIANPHQLRRITYLAKQKL